MRIGISGAHSTGKTTLLNAMRSEHIFNKYAIADEVTRKLQRQGLAINEAGDDQTQLAIMNSHLYNLFMYDHMITDRTILDGMIYSDWLYNENKISKDTYYRVGEIYDRFVKSRPYDIIFYLKPEFDLVDDGTRSTDTQWQKEIAETFEHFIREDKLPVILLTGSVRNRLDNVLNYIED